MPGQLSSNGIQLRSSYFFFGWSCAHSHSLDFFVLLRRTFVNEFEQYTGVHSIKVNDVNVINVNYAQCIYYLFFSLYEFGQKIESNEMLNISKANRCLSIKNKKIKCHLEKAFSAAMTYNSKEKVIESNQYITNDINILGPRPYHSRIVRNDLLNSSKSDLVMECTKYCAYVMVAPINLILCFSEFWCCIERFFLGPKLLDTPTNLRSSLDSPIASSWKLLWNWINLVKSIEKKIDLTIAI